MSVSQRAPDGASRSAVTEVTPHPGLNRRVAARGDHIARVLPRIVATEFVVVAIAAYLASLVYNEFLLMRFPPAGQYVPAALFIATTVLLVSLGFRQFAAIQSQTLRRFVWSGLGAVVVSFSFFLSVMFILKETDIYSRGTFFAQLVVVLTAVAVSRTATIRWLHSAITQGYIEASRVVVIGEERLYTPILSYLTDQGIHAIRGFPFPIRYGAKKPGVNDEIDLRQVKHLIAECRMLRPDDVLIVPADTHQTKVPELAALLSELPASIHLIPLATIDRLGAGRVGELGTQITIELIPKPLSMFDRAAKRAFDITVALFALVLLSPLLLVISIAIKLDSHGPVFFRQTRHGYNNEPIQILKFRSMAAEDGDAFKQAEKGDLRVTRLGKILRRTNVDELPQLFNVLSGEMSIVGPRPHPVALNEQYKQRIAPFMRRHNMKPGITGWAQVNGYRGETQTVEIMQKRVEYDLYYIDNWSFLFDLQIVLLTMLSPKAYMNAY